MPRTERQRAQAAQALAGVQTPSGLELEMKPYLEALGFEHQPQMERLGSPDFWHPRLRIALFADGCYFHSCPICGLDHPDLDTERGIRVYYAMVRDQLINERLASRGIKVARIWEHDWYVDMEAVIRRLYAFCLL